MAIGPKKTTTLLVIAVITSISFVGLLVWSKSGTDEAINSNPDEIAAGDIEASLEDIRRDLTKLERRTDQINTSQVETKREMLNTSSMLLDYMKSGSDLASSTAERSNRGNIRAVPSEQAMRPHEDNIDPFEKDLITVQNLDQFLDGEDRDVEWSRETESEITKSINDELSEATIMTSECRRTICRVEIAFPEDMPTESVVQLTHKITQTSPWNKSGGFVWMEGSEDRELVFYFSREGYGLP